MPFRPLLFSLKKPLPQTFPNRDRSCSRKKLVLISVD